ncbi:MAG TPA: hypothetical protein DCQ58_09510 [Saprospirales bacterium]|nr:hypothetical protein [Saprospirales bacterium]
MRFFQTLPVVIILLLSTIHASIGQQCLTGGSLFVNEFDGSSYPEWIELVVVGDPANPTAPVNLEGWIIDDNNNPTTGVGTATGHLILGSLFSAMIPGTIIVLYDGETLPLPPFPEDGTPNPDGIWVVPHNDAGIDICFSNPSVVPPNGNYVPCTAFSYQTWPLVIGLRNQGDGVQTRRPGGIFYHGTYYGDLTPGMFAPGETTGNLFVGNIQSSLDCGDWFDAANYSDLTPTPGEPNSPLNEALINRIAAGTLDCDDIDAACTLFTCPVIDDIVFDNDITGICVNTAFDITATGLGNMAETDNGEADFGVRFVYFTGIAPPADPYTGGTDISAVPFGALTGIHPDQTATTSVSFPTAGEYNICVVLDPEFTQLTDCEPFACKPITVWEEPEAELSGTHDFCPGDCHQISVQISGGEAPYEVTLRIISFIFNIPITIPSYDLDDQMVICFDGSIPIPTYDIASNTLHIPTLFSGSASLIIDNIIDNHNCSASVINPNNLTLNFFEIPEIVEPGPLVACNEEGDDWASFDLTNLIDEITSGTGVGVHFYEDQNGMTEILNVTNFISETTTIYARIEAACNSEMVEVDLIVEIPPIAGEDALTNLCNDVSGNADFFTLINTGNTSGIWTDDNASGADISDPANVSFFGVTPGVYQFTYTVLSNGVCPDAFAVLTVEITSPPNPGNDGLLNLCEGSTIEFDLFTFLGDIYDNGGIWVDINGSGVDLSDPSQVDFSTLTLGTYQFSYTVAGNGVCPDQTAIVTVNVITEPNPGSPAQVFACNDGTPINLNSALGTHDPGGIWSDEDGALVDLSDPSSVSFNGITPGQYGFLYIILGNGICPEVSALVTVTVEAALNPGSSGQTTLCSGNDTPVDLLSIIGTHDIGGIWIDNNSTGVDLTDPSQVDFSQLGEGNYIFTYHLAGSGICGEQDAVVTVNISPNANPGENTNTFVCSSGNTILDFESLLGPHDPGGNWNDLDGAAVDLTNTQSVDFAGTPQGTYRFSYTIPASGSCPEVSSMITVVISATAFAGNDNDATICAGFSGAINLSNFLTISGVNGTWKQISGDPVDISNPAATDFSLASEGEYIFEFAISNDCGQDTAIITVQISPAINAGADFSTNICINTPYNLFNLLGTHDSGGRWEYDTNNPVSDPQNFVLNSTQTVQLNYVINASLYCQGDTALATLTGITIPDAGIGSTLTVCQGAGWNQNLFTLISGTNDFSGTWQQMSGPGTLNLNNPYIVSVPGSFIGTYTLQYSIQNQCGTDLTLVYLTVQEAQSAGNNYSVDFCESQSSFNLTTLLTGQSAIGTWRNPLGLLVSNPNNVPIPPPGNYVYMHILSANGNCPADTAYAYIHVFAEPFAGNDNSISICEHSTQSINLVQLLGSGISNNGSWADLNGSNVNLSLPTSVIFSGVAPGEYIFRYLVPATGPCPPDNADITVYVQDAPNSGTCDTTYICNGSTSASISLIALLTGEDPGGSFRELTNSGVSLFNPANVDFSAILPGRYIFEYFFPAQGVCAEQSTRIVINVAGTNTLTLDYEFCPAESITIGSQVYSLANPVGTEVFINTSGCDSTVMIRIFPKEIQVNTAYSDENCFGFGSISITGQSNASLPLTLTNSTLGTNIANTIPFIINNIEPGNYYMVITDALGCSISQNFQIADFPGFNISLEDEISLLEGNGYQIEVTTNMIPNIIQWSPAANLSCNNCLNPYATPVVETMYTILIRDQEGCEITDSILIKVERKGDVYIPNVFSPNGDEINPVFFVKSFGVQGVYNLSIFDRWGEKIWHASGLNFNDQFNGWDGSFNGTIVNPGVYVYLIEILHSDGTSEVRSGDILLLR